MEVLFDCVAIEAVAASVPSFTQVLDEEFVGLPQKEITKITDITGITHVRIAPSSTTSADLCLDSAELIFASCPHYRNAITAVLFVSQSRDYLLPTTASILQARLGLSADTLCLDIPSGCTGYLHGLVVASTILSSTSTGKVLLLCGETNSKLINSKDKSLSMLFGDAGSATVLGKRPGVKSFYKFRTDGTGYDKIIIPAGGCRSTFTTHSLRAVECENKNIRRPIDMRMDGMSVFNFAISAVPSLVSETLDACSFSPQSVDLFAAHQANRLIVRQLAKKCGFSEDQSPFLAARIGNTGPVSIPLLLTEGFPRRPSALKRVVMCGFGVGLNWGACSADLSAASIFPTHLSP
jgi:3-oxoacyl-[acyl-carrier-protein] synthase-3